MRREVWHKLKDYPFYMISNFGRVKSIDRVISCAGSKRFFKGKILKPNKIKNGYAVVKIKGVSGYRYCYIHHLVLDSFLCPRPLGKEACHNNGKRSDNRIENLRWDTRSNNALDRHKHGTLDVILRGHKAYNSRFSPKQIKFIRANWCVPYRELGRKFKASHSLISAIINFRSYR